MGFKEEMLCSKSHEYVIKQDDKYVIGLTDYAIEQLGDIVFLELPEVGDEFAKGDTFANIESVKAASEIYMPISGKIVEIQGTAEGEPFSKEQFEKLFALAQNAITDLIKLQKQALGVK